jgi:hypothetical protein
VEAADQLTGGIGAERVLELVAVAPLRFGRDDGLHDEAVEVADAPQRVLDLVGLDRQLLVVGQDLPGHPGVLGPRGDAVGARRDDLEQARLPVGALALGDLGADPVAREGAGDEEHVAVVAGDAVAAVGKAVDGDLDLLPALGPRRARRGVDAGDGGCRVHPPRMAAR